MSQPDPTPNGNPATWDLVIESAASWATPELVARMRARDAKGLATYGTRLQPHNGRDSFEDAEDEILDALVYLKNAELEEPDPGLRRVIGRLYGQVEGLLMEMSWVAGRRRERASGEAGRS